MATVPENNALTLPWLARGLALASVRHGEGVVEWLEANGAHRAARIMKAGVPATSTENSDVGVMQGAFTASMSTASVFYKLYNDQFFRRLPPHQNIGIATSSPNAGIVGEGRPIAVSQTIIEQTILQPVTVGALVVTTREAAFDPGSEQTFVRELKTCIGKAVDATFLSSLFDDTDAITIPATGDAVADLRGALLALGPIGDVSRLAALASVDVGMKTSMLGTEGGGVFPSMTPAGGHLRGLPCLISSGIPSGQLALMDAVQIGAWAGPVAITASGQADIEMVDNPTASSVTPTGASMVSTFMTNSVAMRATAAIAITQLRPCAVLLSGVDWGASP